MAETDTNREPDLAAGDFASWMTEIQAAILGERSSDVPCGSCTACCTASQFIHIGPDETNALRHIPSQLLFPAPRLPRGHVLMGYDQHGRCPMLIDNRCSIYEHRPRTCRTYDCRVFAAADIGTDDDDKVLIDEQARRWQFSHPTHADSFQHDAVRAAAAYLHDRAGSLPAGAVPATSTQRAVLAIEIHDAFLQRDPATGRTTVVELDPEVVRVAITRRTGAADPQDFRR